VAEYLRVGISAERVNFHFEVNYCSFNIHYSFDHVPDHEQYVTAYDSVLPGLPPASDKRRGKKAWV